MNDVPELIVAARLRFRNHQLQHFILDDGQILLLCWMSGVITVFLGTILEAVSFKRIDFFLANILKLGRHFGAVAMAIL